MGYYRVEVRFRNSIKVRYIVYGPGVKVKDLVIIGIYCRALVAGASVLEPTEHISHCSRLLYITQVLIIQGL